MDLFRPDGHLTEEALTALTCEAPLDETARLELAEHLAYCNLCLQRYTDALADAPLLTPERSCQAGLRQRIRARALRLFTSRYAAAVAGVALALTLVWGSGSPRFRLPENRPTVSQGLQKWNTALDGAMSDLNDFFDGLGRTVPPVLGGNER